MRRRAEACRRILDAVAEMRSGLDHRIWREDPDDTRLAADCQVWCELSLALADFLQARSEVQSRRARQIAYARAMQRASGDG